MKPSPRQPRPSIFTMLVVAGLLALLFPRDSRAQDSAAPQPIFAVWLNRHVMQKGEAEIVSFIDDAAKRGVTHIFPNFWFHGCLIYPGSSLAPQHPDFCGWDPMAIVVREAHARGLKVWPWSEYGFFAHYNTTLDEKDCGWLLTHHPEWKTADKDGRVGLVNTGLRVMHFSMNPAHPAAREFLIDLHLDLAKRYAIDGINTDRVRYMNENWGYDSFSQAQFHKAKSAPGAADLTFDEWRRSVITTFAGDFSRRWREAHPELPISAAVNPPAMYREKFQYFDDWVSAGALDYPVPMVYGNEQLFRSELEKTKAMLPKGTSVIAGIDAGQGESSFAAQVKAARELGAAGVCVWDDAAWRRMTYSFAGENPN